MNLSISKISLRNDQDLIIARQRAHRIAALANSSSLDQSRFTTAVSEIARNILQHAGSGVAQFQIVELDSKQYLQALFQDQGPGIPNLAQILEGAYQSKTGMGLGIVNSKKLVDAFSIESEMGKGTVVRLAIAVPENTKITSSAVGKWVRELAEEAPATAAEELDRLNQDLMQKLQELRKKEDKLQRLLETEKNLSHELAETNRGIVSLHRQLEEKNAELERSNQDLEQFAYIASHDLKEPLRGLQTYSIFLLEDYSDKLDEEGQSKLRTLKRLTQRMESLVDSLLYFSRVGRQDLAIARTDLNKVLDGIIDSLHISLAEKAVEVRIPKPLPVIQCDPVRVGEVYRNLLTNAMKYNDRDEKWIEIGVADEPEKLEPNDSDGEGCAGPVFYVRDNGIGIREKHLDKIFTIFKRLHARDKYGGGTGAGLTIVKKIIERHGGRIWVESTTGEGTTFYFTLEKDVLDNTVTVVNESEVGQHCS